MYQRLAIFISVLALLLALFTMVLMAVIVSMPDRAWGEALPSCQPPPVNIDTDVVVESNTAVGVTVEGSHNNPGDHNNDKRELLPAGPVDMPHWTSPYLGEHEANTPFFAPLLDIVGEKLTWTTEEAEGFMGYGSVRVELHLWRRPPPLGVVTIRGYIPHGFELVGSVIVWAEAEGTNSHTLWGAAAKKLCEEVGVDVILVEEGANEATSGETKGSGFALRLGGLIEAFGVTGGPDLMRSRQWMEKIDKPWMVFRAVAPVPKPWEALPQMTPIPRHGEPMLGKEGWTYE